jgi:serine protease Do
MPSAPTISVPTQAASSCIALSLLVFAFAQYAYAQESAQNTAPPISASLSGGFDGAIVFRLVRNSIAVVRTDAGSLGSAVAVAHDAGVTLLATNCHVLEGAAEIKVTANGLTERAEFAGGDAADDACLLTVKMKMPVVETFNAFDLKVGEKVFAVGAPRGLELTISDGIVSSLRKPGLLDSLLIQNTAPISPGSSGGGLFDARARLIGITSFLLKDSQNINFATSINTYTSVVKRPKITTLQRLNEDFSTRKRDRK